MRTISKDIELEGRSVDLLSELPCSQVIERGKLKTIYECDGVPDGLYLVIDGWVKTWRQRANAQRRTVMDFHGVDDVFGELCILPGFGPPEPGDEICATGAIALSRVRLMFWPEAELRRLMSARPALADALMLTAVKRCEGYVARIEEMVACTMEDRLGQLLLRLGRRFGTSDQPGGITGLPHFTHEALADYIGTSREIVTGKFNKLRRNGLVSYSRKGIGIRTPEIEAWLREKRADATRAA